MSATKFSAPATRPNRATSHRRRRHTLDRLLLCESLEPRLLLSVDSWMLPTDIQVALPGAPDVAADADGNVYIAAKRADPDVSKYTPDIWLRKYSSDGEVQWTNDLRLPDAQWVYGIAVDSGDDHRVGGVYVAGSFTGTPNLDPAGSAAGQLQPHQGGQDAFLVKYDLENGGFLWAHQWEAMMTEAIA